MDSSKSFEDENFDPEKIEDRDFQVEKQLILNDLLPKKSRAQYEFEYAKTESNALCINEYDVGIFKRNIQIQNMETVYFMEYLV